MFIFFAINVLCLFLSFTCAAAFNVASMCFCSLNWDSKGLRTQPTKSHVHMFKWSEVWVFVGHMCSVFFYPTIGRRQNTISSTISWFAAEWSKLFDSLVDALHPLQEEEEEDEWADFAPQNHAVVKALQKPWMLHEEAAAVIHFPQNRSLHRM